MYYGDHAPPHFHASYEGQDCIIEIQRLYVIEGGLSPRALGLVFEWAALHKSELIEAWNRAEKNQSPGKIEPLS